MPLPTPEQIDKTRPKDEQAKTRLKALMAGLSGVAFEAFSLWGQGRHQSPLATVEIAVGGTITYALIVWVVLTLLPEVRDRDTGRASKRETNVRAATHAGVD